MRLTAKRTFVIWLILLAGFVALYVMPDEVGHALIGGALGFAGLLGFGLVAKTLLAWFRRGGRWPKRGWGRFGALGLAILAPPALATWTASHMGLAAAIGSIAIYAILVPQAWRAMRARRCLRGLARTLATGGDPAKWIAELEAHRTLQYLGALPLLLRHHRADVVDKLAPAGEWQFAAEPDHAVALIELERLPEARAKLDALAGRGEAPATIEHIALIGVRLAIAEGAPPATLIDAPTQPDLRLEVLADLLAARGDREGARRELIALRERTGDDVLRSLAGSSRPSATMAAEVLAGTSSTPYR